MANLRELFDSVKRVDSYQRVDSTHPLELYAGLDELSRWTLLLLCDIRPQHLYSTRVIYAKIGQRQDGKWSVSLSLMNDEYQDIFILFCGDIIESSRLVCNKDKAAQFVVRRYLEWKDMLANSKSGLLSAEEIKGLLGEMYILDSELMNRYGIEKAAVSWTGPRALHQDFVIDDTWYEIKTISSSKEEVRISSVEQLDCENEGYLVVVYADRTSITNIKAVNLNLIYTRLVSRIMDDDVKSDFCSMLLKYGYYPRPEYEDADYTFEIKGVRYYRITQSFPCFRRKSIPANITKVDYMISLSAVKDYME